MSRQSSSALPIHRGSVNYYAGRNSLSSVSTAAAEAASVVFRAYVQKEQQHRFATDQYPYDETPKRLSLQGVGTDRNSPL